MRLDRTLAMAGIALMLGAAAAWTQPDSTRTRGAGSSKATTSASARGASVSRGAAAAAEPMVVMPADSVRWGDAPNALPPGARFAVLDGDPGKAGVFTVRIRMPDGYRVPPHWHPTMEHVTVISGTFGIGMGDTFDPAKGTVMGPGGFSGLPARMHHYAWAVGETVVQVHGMGPFAITYLNPADDPRGTSR